MMKTYNLIPKKRFMPVLNFNWYSDTGEIESPQLDFIHGYIESRVDDDKTILLENRTIYTFDGGITENEQCLAVIFGADYILPDDLLAAYPISEETTVTEGLIIVY